MDAEIGRDPGQVGSSQDDAPVTACKRILCSADRACDGDGKEGVFPMGEMGGHQKYTER